ncbi:dibenzothiophene desulfurization enzyme [Ancylobacter novellus DSM 506]|uniref:Dibenzothiophene desulfurization enzyme n=1 Tax=Ancylobacter novellus (strain ATCC 8093 / DSM 506 / JCM 20403 / CCM 1077 / IAM 12100 / NBRC 12443 / NCIMB 10456) TaxID=639283 RepID=D7A1J9_ANCN5|nr:LLM class flavin-dependent oxidoreductase [Ancylobacter novellus]ADH91424.1 dibenzothiophene desulfurization enzyme [Ancylobacter novellus DSM 506]
MTRQMHLVAFLFAGPTSHHHGMWRHPETQNAFLDPATYEHVARVLEQGRFDSLFFADVLGISDYYNGSYDTMLGKGGQMGLLDPVPLLTLMARATQHIGLGATISTSLFNPYHIARTLGTLDHLSGGRVAWNVVTSSSSLEAHNFGLDGLPARNERYDRADEVVEACIGLWHSWEDGALVLDKKAGTFADPSKVHPVNYQGRWIKTAGPLTVPRSPQGHPVIMQAGSSDRGREFAARWSEIIFTLQHDISGMQAFYSDIKVRMGKYGRAPEECAILTSVDPIIGETESIAREKQAYINSLVDAELGMALVSYHLGVDLSRYPADQPLSDIQLEEGSRGSFDILVKATQADGLTLGQAAQRFATSELCPQVVGTPESVADQLQTFFEAKGCDGFILTPTAFPGTFESFARSVSPILQERGVLRKDYTGKTLRENLRS